MAERKEGSAERKRPDGREKVDVKDELDQLVDDFRRDLIDPLQRWWRRSGPPQWSWANARTPRVDLRDLGSTYEVVAELPGIPKDKVQLSVEGSRMEIRAEHAEPTEARVSGEPRKAADRIAYYRSLALPVDADPQGVKAVMRDGILHVTLPKSTGKDKPGRKVKVE